MKEILKNYDGKVKLAYRHYPLGSHENACGAALAAEAAGEQGKFWEMHDLLFERFRADGAKALAREKLTSYAEALNLDMKRFGDAMDSERFGPKVKQDAQEAEKYGVSGTPTFFVNGRKVIGAMSYDQMNRIIQEELAKVSGK